MGHVFHPGHHELHGITVVVETHGARTYVGRFDHEDGSGVHLLDVGMHDATAAGPREEYLERTQRFGVRADHKHLIVPRAEIAAIRRLG
ncbi:MAG TPA: hypothetical protein VFM14_10545 [Gemmatimonadales bacterium]|nr:hypothetical protein [Gemmatimonadales bacterium]